MEIKKSTFWLYLGTFFLVIKTMLSTSKIVYYNDAIDTILSSIGALSLLISMTMKQYTKKTKIIYICSLLLTTYNAWITKNNAMIITVLTCLALRSCDLTNYVIFIFKMQCIILITHTAIAVIGYFFGVFNIIQNIGGTYRYDFGMHHPNTFAAFVFNLIIMAIWLYWDEIKEKHIFYMISFISVIYIFCKTRTNFILLLFVFGMFLVSGIKHKYERVIEIITYAIIPSLTIFLAIMILAFPRGNYIVLLLNKVLNARILLGSYALMNCGFTFFGQDLTSLYTGTTWDPFWQLKSFTFDSIYTYMLVNQGIIWLLIISVFFAKIAKRKNTKDNIAIIAWALYGVTEVQGLNCFSCMPILLLTKLFGKEVKNNE